MSLRLKTFFSFWVEIVLLIVLVIALGFLTNAKINMVPQNENERDANEQKAYDYLQYGITYGWSIFAIVAIYLAYRTFTAKRKSKDKNKITILLGILLFILGIIGTVAAKNLKDSPNYEENKPYYNDCKWIAIVFVGIGCLLFLKWIIGIFKKTDKEKALEAIEKNQKMAIELQELKNQNVQLQNSTNTTKTTKSA